MSQGLLYFAKGEEFVSEATRSAIRASAVMPDYPITIVADRECDADCFDTVIVDSTPFEKKDKPRALQRTPYDQTIYLDSDTYLTGSISELYDLLREFDVGVKRNRDQAHVSPSSSVPTAFPEFNSGVIVFQSTDSVMRMFSDWEKRCHSAEEFDQPSFREALFYSDVRFTCLPNRFNCMYQYDNIVAGRVMVVHGPLVDSQGNMIDIQDTISRLNDSHQTRLYYWWNGKVHVIPPQPLWAWIYQMVRQDGMREVLSKAREQFAQWLPLHE